jgi:hypothetical protein
MQNSSNFCILIYINYYYKFSFSAHILCICIKGAYFVHLAITVQCTNFKNFHRRAKETFREFLAYDVRKIRISIFQRNYSHTWKLIFCEHSASVHACWFASKDWHFFSFWLSVGKAIPPDGKKYAFCRGRDCTVLQAVRFVVMF